MKADPRAEGVYQQVQEWLEAAGTHGAGVHFLPPLRVVVYEYEPLDAFATGALAPNQLVTSHLLTFEPITKIYGRKLQLGARCLSKPHLIIWKDPSYIMLTRVDRILEGLDNQEPEDREFDR